jgi:hypothetical protein
VAEGIDDTLEIKKKHFHSSDKFANQTINNQLAERAKFKRGRPRKNSQKIVCKLL